MQAPVLLFLCTIGALWADGHRILTGSESTESEPKSGGYSAPHLGHLSEGEMLAAEMREAEELEAAVHSELEIVRAHIESLRSRIAGLGPAPADESQANIEPVSGESGVPLFLAELAIGWQELGDWVTGTIDEDDTTSFERSEEYLRPRTLQQCTAKMAHIQGKTPKSKATEQHLVGEALSVLKNAVTLGLPDAELKQLRASAQRTIMKLHEAHQSHFALTVAQLRQQLLESADDASASASLNTATREGLSQQMAATVAFEHGHKIRDDKFALRVYGKFLMEQGFWNPQKKAFYQQYLQTNGDNKNHVK